MALARGTRLGSYEVIAPLGAGGMGEVYRARDQKLEREVAIKVIHDESASDPKRLRRFEREARAASALNHPSIITIHDVGREGSMPFIVMELVTGKTLRTALSGGPLATPELLKLATQITDGLAKAHEAGILHRDLKPENLMITEDGFVKILDFGLAKQLPGAGSNPDASTMDRDTTAGAIMGTAAYMSPEQARGAELDFRSDQFSLGTILYEVASGTKLFGRDTLAATLSAILVEEPDPLAALNPDLPRRFVTIVHRLLAKDPRRRYGSTRDLAIDIEEVGNFDHESIAIALPDLPVHEEARASSSEKSPVFAGGERRKATIVVTRLSGYDALVEELDPAELDRFTSRLRNAANDIAGTHDGVLNHFGSDELVLLFGIPAALEDHFHRAVLAAKGLHAALAELSRDTGATLQIQTGIDTGAVVSQRLDSGESPFRVSGDAVHVASALVAQAQQGEILVSSETRQLVERFFETEKTQSVDVPGRTSPVTVFRVGAGSGARSRLDAAEKAGLTDYTGRDEELAILLGCFEKARSGQGQFVGVVGEAGLGKSRLIHELVHRLEGVDCRIIVGRCRADAAAKPYLPFVEATKELLDIDDSVETDEIVRRIVAIDPELERFLPIYLHLLARDSEQHPLSDELKGKEFQLTTMHCLSALFTLASSAQPILTILEDWHWSDAASKATLRELAELVSAHPGMVIATTRPEVGVETLPDPQSATVRLDTLAPADAASIMKAVLNVERLPDALGERIHERTGGNPFFIEEICRGLLEEKTVTVEDRVANVAGQLDSLHLPTTVQAVIRARMDRLDPDAQGVLRVASVIGREFSSRLLARAVGEFIDVKRCLQSLKELELVQAIRVVPEPMLRFKHALTQDVAYESLLKHQRKQAHRSVGEALEDIFSERVEHDAGILAHHFAKAEMWEKAVSYGMVDAERVYQLRRPVEALEILDRVQGFVAKLPELDPSTWIDVLVAQEARCSELGLRTRQQQILNEVIPLVEATGNQSRLAAFHARQGLLHTELDHFPEAQRALDTSLTLARASSDRRIEMQALENVGFLCWRQDKLDEALAHNEAALAISLELDDTSTRITIFGNLTNVYRGLGQFENALSANDEAMRLGEALDNNHMTGLAMWARAQIYRDLGRNEEAIDLYRRGNERKRELGQFIFLPLDLATLLWREGRISESLEIFNLQFEQNRKVRNFHFLAIGQGTLAQLYLSSDHPERAVPILLESAELYGNIGDDENQEAALNSAASVLERLGHYGRAKAVWESVLALGQEQGKSAVEIKGRESLAQLERLPSGDPECARQHLHEALAVANASGDREAESRVLNSLGIFEWSRGDFETALAHYERALVIVRDVDDEKHEGLILASLGVTLRKLGRLDEAAHMLDEAVIAHRRTGAGVLEGHALAALGDVHRDSGESARAIRYYQDSLELRRAVADRVGEGWMLIRIAELSSTEKLRELAEDYARQAIAVAAACDDARLIEACTKLEIK